MTATLTEAAYASSLQDGLFSIDLDNKVHDIFGPGKFATLGHGDYESLKPALQAASLIVTTMIQDFWLALAQGEILPCRKDAVPGTNATFKRRKLTTDMSQADRCAVTTALTDLTKHIRCFIFFALDNLDGRTHPITCNGKRCCSIKLDSHLLQNVKDAPTDAAKSHHLFYLTITILHEIVHAANDMLRHVPDGKPRSAASELFFEDDVICELGEAYESLLLGGIPTLCCQQIMLQAWPWTKRRLEGHILTSGSTAKARGKLPKCDVTYGVAASDVEKVFNKAF